MPFLSFSVSLSVWLMFLGLFSFFLSLLRLRQPGVARWREGQDLHEVKNGHRFTADLVCGHVVPDADVSIQTRDKA